MTNFDSIVSKYGLENNHRPLWKIIVRMTREDMDELITYIKTQIAYHRYVSSYSREVCLMYAYWWQKNFQGGRGGHNYEDALKDFGLNNYDVSIFKNAVTDELRDRRRLAISVYRQTNNRWLDSVFAQGGIPLNWLREGLNNSQLQKFLKTLLSYYENIASPDWYDLRTAIEIADNLGLPEIVKSEAYCSYCLFVVKSIIGNEEVDYGIEDIMDIIEGLKNIHQNNSISYFGISWSFKQEFGNNLSICYTLRIPKTIADDDDSQVISRRYYLNGKFVAEYLRQGKSFILQPGHNEPINQVLGEGVENMFLERMDDNKGLLPEVLSNSTIPLIEEPIMVDCSTNYWKIDSGYSNDIAYIIYPKNWKPETEVDAISFGFGDIELQRCTINWNDCENEAIAFHSDNSESTIRRNNVNYHVYLNFPQYEWIESSNKLIVESGQNLRDYISVRDATGTRINYGKWKLQLKTNEGYIEYNRNCNLLYGINNLRICLPNGRNKYIQFFLTDKIEYRCLPNNRMIFNSSAIVNNNIICTLSEDQRVSLKDGEYVCDDNISSVRFTLRAFGTEVKVAVAAPKPNSSFWDMETNKKLNYNKAIPLSQLYKYKVYVNGNNRVNIILEDIQAQEQLMSVTLDWSKDKFHTLSFASGIIERMLMLFPLTRFRTLKIFIGNYSLTISGNHYLIESTGEGGIYKLTVYGNNVPVSGLSLSAVSIPTMLTKTNEIELVEDTVAGVYNIPAEIAKEPFIVFSRNSSFAFAPQKIDFNEVEDKSVVMQIAKRNNEKNNSLAEISELLSSYNEESWSHVWEQFALTVRYRLPYLTFNSLVAISNNPYYLAYFITQIRTKYPEAPEDIVLELERMEREHGFAFHAIPKECWQIAVENIRTVYTTLQKELSLCGISEDEYINSCCNLYEELITRQFGNNNIYLWQIFSSWEHPKVKICQEQPLSAYITGTYLVGRATMHLPTFNKLGKIDNPWPFARLNECRTAENYMRYFAVACPQISARNAQNFDDNYWKYSKSSDCLRRLANYMRQYASEVYNCIFLAQLNN